MADSVQPTVTKLQSLIEGFFWILPNLGIALLIFALFLGAAWTAKWSVASIANRRDRADLGILLGSFVRADEIKSGDFEGTVERVEARATLIRTYDGQRVMIPNTDIYTRAVLVRTAFDKRRSEYDVGIGQGDDIAGACRVILEALREVDGVESDPAPEAVPWELAGSTVNLKVRWWTKSSRAKLVLVQGRVISAVKEALTEASIDLPFPTRVVLWHDQTDEFDGNRLHQREGWPVGSKSPRSCRDKAKTVKTSDRSTLAQHIVDEDGGPTDNSSPTPR